MSISRFKFWLEQVDPYAIQRVVFYKALFIATVMVYVYWLFLPVNFLAFVCPFFMVFFYETPSIASFAKKEQLLLFLGAGIISVNVSFNLIYPFKVTFFFFSLILLALLYYLVLKYFYAFKNLTMLMLSSGAIILSGQPPATLQTAYDLISAVLLSMTTLLICLRVVPNHYLVVWRKALQHYIAHLEEDINASLNEHHYTAIQDEITRFEMVRNYQRLVGKQYILPTFRIATYIRNIQLSLDNLYYEEKNEQFWCTVNHHLQQFKHHLIISAPYNPQELHLNPNTFLQHYVCTNLKRSFSHWSALCAQQSS